MILVAQPPADVAIKIFSSEIRKYHKYSLGELISNSKSTLNIQNTFNFIFGANVRDCVIGEEFFSEMNRFFYALIFSSLLNIFKTS
jgi:hypothetical protein